MHVCMYGWMYVLGQSYYRSLVAPRVQDHVHEDDAVDMDIIMIINCIISIMIICAIIIINSTSSSSSSSSSIHIIIIIISSSISVSYRSARGTGSRTWR